MASGQSSSIELREIRHFHLFCGLGGGARGFNRGSARVGNMEAVYRCIGGVDVSPAAIRDFERLAGVPGTVLDLFNVEQYAAFHGRPAPAGWHAATPQDIQRAAGNERPHIVFLSSRPKRASVKRLSKCYRCHDDLVIGTTCIEIPKLGQAYSTDRRVCDTCFQLILSKTDDDLAEIKKL